jgi:Xaa-Pro aminopeptidase
MVPAIWRQDDLLAPLLDVVNRQVVDALLAEGFGGIRIEDTILIGTATEQGPAVLTADLPTDHNAVAALVSGR